MKVILYPRVSSKKQVEQGDSIDSQVNRLKAFCEEKGYEIVEVYTDAGKSATLDDDTFDIKIKGNKLAVDIDLKKRPAFKRILEDAARKTFNAVVFYKWDRFSRNIILSKLAQIFLRRGGIELIPSDDVVDPLMIEIKNALSEEEIRKMRERVRLTRTNQFNKGVMVGRCPVGYRAIYRDKRKKKGIERIEIDKIKGDMVKDIFSMAANGDSYTSICKKHNLKPQQYYNIIRNKVYTGIIIFEGEEKQGKHEALISKELFEKVNGG